MHAQPVSLPPETSALQFFVHHLTIWSKFTLLPYDIHIERIDVSNAISYSTLQSTLTLSSVDDVYRHHDLTVSITLLV
jgi:hypothetical protein